MTEVNLNVSIIEQTCVAAFRDACFLLGREFTAVISEPGVFEGFPQDIVDTGQLRASQELVFRSPTEANFSWNVAYGNFIHDGYTMRNGTVVEGRPWTTKALERFEFDRVYGELLSDRLIG